MKVRELIQKLNQLPESEFDRDVIIELSDNPDVSFTMDEVLVTKFFPGNLGREDNDFLRLRSHTGHSVCAHQPYLIKDADPELEKLLDEEEREESISRSEPAPYPYHRWACAGAPYGVCQYDIQNDPAMDHCVFCHEPLERK